MTVKELDSVLIYGNIRIFINEEYYKTYRCLDLIPHRILTAVVEWINPVIIKNEIFLDVYIGGIK